MSKADDEDYASLSDDEKRRGNRAALILACVSIGPMISAAPLMLAGLVGWGLILTWIGAVLLFSEMVFTRQVDIFFDGEDVTGRRGYLTEADRRQYRKVGLAGYVGCFLLLAWIFEPSLSKEGYCCVSRFVAANGG